MIIFYDKKTGEIRGRIDGRVHTEDHLRMWHGTPEENDRIVVNWKPIKFYDRNGNEVREGAHDRLGRSLVFTADYSPDHEQAELMFELDKKPADLKKYKVDLVTKKLVLNDV